MKKKYLNALVLTISLLLLFGGTYSINTNSKSCVYKKVNVKPTALTTASTAIPPTQLIVVTEQMIYTENILEVCVLSSTTKSLLSNELTDRIRKNKVN